MAPVYYIFTPCCGGDDLYFQTDPSGILPYALPHQLIYDAYAWDTTPPGVPTYGDQYGLVSGTCYTVSTGIVATGEPIETLLQFFSLPILSNSWMSFTAAGYTDCDPLYGECKPCPDCYLLISCDGSVPPFTTNQDLAAIGATPGGSYILGSPDYGDVCFQVLLAPEALLPCDTSAPVLSYIDTCICDCDCYSVIANSKNCYYIDCNGNLVNTGALTGTEIKFCSLTYPIIVGNQWPLPFYITNTGACVNQICPEECYELVDCDGLQDPIFTTKPSLGQYAIIGQVVIIEGYPDTCWIVNSVADCECAIDVVVLQSYADCPTCKNPSKYKLINCADSGTIVYTSSDLSAVVGQVITILDCPGCWFVEEIPDIPSDTIVIVNQVYVDCVECEREYYQLIDCTGYMAPIITYTDLSAYIGSVIKLKYCPDTCWSVNITQNFQDAGIVIPETEYVDCPECLRTFPCICTTVRNDSDIALDYRYYDCDIAVQQFTLQPGETSPKFCIRAWSIYFPDTDYIVQHGDCTQVMQDPWGCPPEVYPRRSVQPGYNTPACTADKYEKISCKSAEVYYKQVLYLRYGISDCCPEDTDKWLIKKELIDMDALRDPNWVCTISTCGCPPASCNCTPLSTTCNSQ